MALAAGTGHDTEVGVEQGTEDDTEVGAELGTEEVLSVSSVLEGIVILKDNPDYEASEESK